MKGNVSFIHHSSFLLRGLMEALVLELLPLVFVLAGEVAGEGLDGDAGLGAERAPEDEAGVELSRPFRNFVRHLRFLVRHCRPAPSGQRLSDSVAKKRSGQ